MKRVIKIEYTENKDFEVVVGYICKYCNEIFLSTKHRCRYNPRYKGCYTCRNNEGLTDTDAEEESVFSLNLDENDKELINKKVIKCRKGINPSLDSVSSNGWDYRCTDWEDEHMADGKTNPINKEI